MARTQTILSIEAGTSQDFPLTMKDLTGNQIDLTGATSNEVLFKYRLNDPDSIARITLAVGSGVTVTNAANGRLFITLLPTHTANVTGTATVVYFWAAKAYFSTTFEKYGAAGKLFIQPQGIQAI